MERIIEILEDIQPGVDYSSSERLIDDHLLDSLSILSLVVELEEEFDITISAVEVVPKNFNSIKAMFEMVTRLQEE